MNSSEIVEFLQKAAAEPSSAAPMNTLGTITSTTSGTTVGKQNGKAFPSFKPLKVNTNLNKYKNVFFSESAPMLKKVENFAEAHTTKLPVTNEEEGLKKNQARFTTAPVNPQKSLLP